MRCSWGSMDLVGSQRWRVAVLVLLPLLVPGYGLASADDYYDIGQFHQPVTTDSDEAQTWFDRGLAMCHAFNHGEAIRCFERAHAADPGMPMALWGLAYALGPNINLVQLEPHVVAQAAMAARLADNLKSRASGWERAVIEALGERYATPPPETLAELNQAYASAMRDVYRQHPDQPTVAALFAEALMMLRPWQFYAADGTPAPETPEIEQVLERALQAWPDHPALCHFYIHTVEASPDPLRALPAADRLGKLMPGAGHLVHMPTHIYAHAGDYENVINGNARAIEVDEQFVAQAGRHNFYTYYRIHNYHFLVYGAMFDGQSELALQIARMIPQQVPEDMLREQADFLDAFMPTTLHVLVRFGRWDEILSEPEPADYLPMSRAIWRYARGVAQAAKGNVTAALAEQEAFMAAKQAVPESSLLFQNTSLAILGVAEQMLAGEIAYRQGRYDEAFTHLREAVRRDDELNYDEPWGWMQPARHALGALLLEQQQAVEAEQVYRADLRRHPRNLWSLQGLSEALQQQGREEEAEPFRRQLAVAAQRADVTVDRSCFCRRVPADSSP